MIFRPYFVLLLLNVYKHFFFYSAASASYSAFCIEEAPESCTPDKSALPLYLSLEAPESLPVARSVIVMKASDEPLRYISSVFVVKSGIVASDEPFASIFALSATPDILH